MSLVRSLLKQVAEVARENGGGIVAHIEVEIGPLTGVEPELLRLAFELIKQETGDDRAELAVHQVPMVVHCSNCDTDSELARFVFRCGNCNSGEVRVISGDEFRLLNITLDRACHAI